ncbi:hypothetical protein A0H81_00516 [Grifola frondosa]|uniref:Uncharacterized protein n=1 Tax=Grifola frondosa TaxID=5627 RepID=A0A1C7MQ19_GRIFR|nr:hypothetical protein A0H81_00516 [Grifola frondosa]
MIKDDDRSVPSVNLALPPVGWQRTLAHAAQRTTVCAWEKTVVIAKQPSKSVQSECLVRTWALYIHEVGIGRLHQPLELVAALFVLMRRVKEIDGESLISDDT